MKGWKGVLTRGKTSGATDKPLPNEPPKQEVPTIDTTTIQQSQSVPLTSPSTPAILVSALDDKPDLVWYSLALFLSDDQASFIYSM
jgi:hypothetical protein